MWHNGFGYDPGIFFVVGLFKFLGWVLILGLIFGAIRFFKRARYAGTGMGMSACGPRAAWSGRMGGFGKDEALETARERLAKSELTPEQFETIRKGLQGNQPAQPDWNDHERWHEMKRNLRDMRRGWGKDGALETARLRFAKGEISAEEFEMIRRTLEN